jgi:hypothetical protein
MKTWKTILVGLAGVSVGIIAMLVGLPIAKSAVDCFGAPRVTVMNATGGDISSVTMTLGTIKQPIPDMKDGHARTVRMPGHFSESSTHVSWSDSAGTHVESAGDYMESYGFYRAIVVLTPDRKARAIYEIKESTPSRTVSSR